MARPAPEILTGLLAGGFLLLAVGLFAFWFRGADRDLEDAAGRARNTAQRVREEAPEHASVAYRDALHQLRGISQGALTDVEEHLRQQRSALFEWFAGVRLQPGNGVPFTDSFRERYAFAEDELRRRLFALASEQGFSSDRAMPLYQPAFVAEGRDPRDLAEMQAAQRDFHLQERVLLAAASVGAMPHAEIEFRTPTDGERGRFVSHRMTLRLEVADQQLPALLRAVRAGDPNQVLLQVEGLATRPAPLAEEGSRGAAPRILVDLVVGVRVPRAAEGRS